MKINCSIKAKNKIAEHLVPNLLLIETSTAVCSVAVASEGVVLASRTVCSTKSHSAQLLPFVEEVLCQTAIEATSLHAVAVSSGPGSYTGLRIGVSTAKGLCYALGLPLIAVDSLHAMADAFSRENAKALGKQDLIIPVVDARRMEVYAAIFDAKANLLQTTKALVLNEQSLAQWCGHTIWLIGDGAAKTAELFRGNQQIIVIPDFLPTASHLTNLAFHLYENATFADLAYFEPFYLKDFVAGIPKVKGLQ